MCGVGGDVVAVRRGGVLCWRCLDDGDVGDGDYVVGDDHVGGELVSTRGGISTGGCLPWWNDIGDDASGGDAFFLLRRGGGVVPWLVQLWR